MKLVLISDTHGMHDQITLPSGDVLIHSGDFTSFGEDHELIKFRSWFKKQKHKRKLMICGNHEKKVSGNRQYVKEFFEINTDIQVINNETVEIDGYKFYGEPRTPEFYNWGWAYNRGKEAEEVWSQCPEGIDVLVCHGPPKGYGDHVLRRFPHNFGGMGGWIENVGCEAQLERLKVVKPSLVVCGHIHYGYGIYLTDFGTTVSNAAICTEAYLPTNKPIVMEI